jgi:diguanylate cyclase (GGDEF)-like protein
LQLRVFLVILVSIGGICLIALAFMLPQWRKQWARPRDFDPARWLELAEAVAPIGYWRVVLADHHLTWSDGTFRIHQLPPGAMPPKFQDAITIYHPEDREAVVHHVQQAIATRSGFEVILRLLGTNGGLTPVLSRGAVEIGKNGAVVSVFGILLDLSEPRRLEAVLRQAEAENAALRLRLDELAIEDRLTRLATRQHFEACFAKEFKRSLRKATSLALIMIDLDHFAHYNDLYGRRAGDRCLQQLGRLVLDALQGPSDIAARTGGNRFALLLPDTDEIGAGMVAEHIIAALRALALEHQGNANHNIVTVSAGVAAVVPAGDDDPGRLSEHADIALYRAKRTGRNSVCFYSCETIHSIAAKLPGQALVLDGDLEALHPIPLD